MTARDPASSSLVDARYERLKKALCDHAEEWERDASEADAAADSYRGIDTEAVVDLLRQASRSRSRAKELRSILGRAESDA